jgi:endonuclease/exonuclease/phosphatase (EEP) superfamily protein YafD
MSEQNSHSAPILRLLQGLFRMLGDPARAERFVRLGKRIVWFLLLLYTAGLALGLLWLEFGGDRWWMTWVLLYLPPALLLFPLGLLVPLGLLFDWRTLYAAIGCVVVVFVFYDDLELHRPRQPRDPAREVRIVCNNIGSSGNHRLTPFVEQHDPDLILLQEAQRRGGGYAEQYGERGLHTGYHGEFVFASRSPILESSLVDDILCDGHPVAARFVTEAHGRRIVVYNVHIASPRRLLDKLRGKGGVAQVLHDFGLSVGRDYEASEKVAERLAAARALRERIAAETDPVIVAGDFNIPARGQAYHLFAKQFQDTFEKRGRGYGFTFPGRTRNPFSLFGPWLRLDLIFASKDWRVLDAQSEPERPSQHRAVFASIELLEP